MLPLASPDFPALPCPTYPTSFPRCHLPSPPEARNVRTKPSKNYRITWKNTSSGRILTLLTKIGPPYVLPPPPGYPTCSVQSYKTSGRNAPPELTHRPLALGRKRETLASITKIDTTTSAYPPLPTTTTGPGHISICTCKRKKEKEKSSPIQKSGYISHFVKDPPPLSPSVSWDLDICRFLICRDDEMQRPPLPRAGHSCSSGPRVYVYMFMYM